MSKSSPELIRTFDWTPLTLAIQKIVAVPFSRVSGAAAGGGDLFAYDVTLPTPTQIEDGLSNGGEGLPVPLARGTFTPQVSGSVREIYASKLGERENDGRG